MLFKALSPELTMKEKPKSRLFWIINVLLSFGPKCKNEKDLLHFLQSSQCVYPSQKGQPGVKYLLTQGGPPSATLRVRFATIMHTVQKLLSRQLLDSQGPVTYFRSFS